VGCERVNKVGNVGTIRAYSTTVRPGTSGPIKFFVFCGMTLLTGKLCQLADLPGSGIPESSNGLANGLEPATGIVYKAALLPLRSTP
jgi:hypothetical protein